MYIKSCYIENFGKLHEFNIEFKQGLNVIKEDNGWGKTTLMAFIKAMLYGMIYRPNAKEFYDRKKYEPWQGGRFGGYIIFEVDGTEYKVTRFFGKKDVQDEFELVDMRTGKPSDAYSEKLGEEIFGIDMDSYERSVYISGDKRSSITDSINAKLNNLIENADDIGNFDNAYDSLDKVIKALNKRGGAGEIQKKSERIKELEEACNICDSKSQQIELYQNNIAEYLLKKQEYETNINAIDDRMAGIELYNKQKQYTGLKNKVNESKTDLEKLEKFFGKYRSDEDEIVSYNNISSEVAALNNSIQALGNLNDIKEYNEDEEKAIERSIGLYNEASELAIEIKSELAACEAVAKEYEAVKAKDEESDNTLNSSKGHSSLLYTVLIVMAVGIAGFGVVDLIRSITGFGVVFIFLGILLALASIIPCLSASNQKKTAIKSMQEGIIRRDEEYRNLIKEKERCISQLRDRKAALESEYNTYINSKLDAPTGNVIKDLSQIRDNVMKYNNYHNYMGKLTHCESRLNEFLANYDYSGCNCCESYYEKLQCIRDNLRDYRLVRNNYSKLKVEFDEYENEINTLRNRQDILSVPEEKIGETDIVTLQEKRRYWQHELQKLTEYISRTEKTIEDISIEVDRKQEYESEIGRLKEELLILEEKHRIYTITRDSLAVAKENLSTRYMAGMKAAFEKYVNIFELTDKIKLGLDLNTRMEKNGKDWESKYFSTGYGDLLDICVRLALVDAMFVDEQPFIVLDDPFVNFDDKKLNKVREAIEVIAHDRQIIYTVCHESRA